ncbi:MAG: SOS response-associated peptidase [Ignavibacteriales bacterium]|nr:SOS response-associated peptidase [Ignavibacteriales bacterium]
MCGRYAIINGKKIFATFAMLREMEKQITPALAAPHYNAAPTERLPIVFQSPEELAIRDATWWMIPHWSKSGKPDMKFASFNARAETITTSKLFAPYFKDHRCLIPADGFYEWKRDAGTKTPMFIHRRDEAIFMMAGVYSIWKSETGDERPSFSIITTDANEVMRGIHHRMPVILSEPEFDQWLDRSNNDVDSLRMLLQPAPSEGMQTYPVTSRVNNSRYQEPDCVIDVTQ